MNRPLQLFQIVQAAIRMLKESHEVHEPRHYHPHSTRPLAEIFSAFDYDRNNPFDKQGPECQRYLV